jgi:hypothetical protein
VFSNEHYDFQCFVQTLVSQSASEVDRSIMNVVEGLNFQCLNDNFEFSALLVWPNIIFVACKFSFKNLDEL